jgi:hypothetical protein
MSTATKANNARPPITPPTTGPMSDDCVITEAVAGKDDDDAVVLVIDTEGDAVDVDAVSSVRDDVVTFVITKLLDVVIRGVVAASSVFDVGIGVIDSNVLIGLVIVDVGNNVGHIVL